MFPYWLLFSIFAAGSFGAVRSQPPSLNKAPLFFAAALFAVLFVGLRYEVGGDWLGYEDIFDAARQRNFAGALVIGDPAYLALNWTSNRLGYDIRLVNLACAAIFMWGIIRFARVQPNPWLTVAVSVPYLIVVVAMGYTRQGVAIALIMAAIPAFQERRYMSAALCIFFAVTFHKTAVVIVPIIAMSTIRQRFLIYSSAAMLGAFLFFNFIDLVLNTLIRNYTDTTMRSDGAGIRVAMNLVATAIYLPAQRRFTVSEQERVLWRNFALISILMFFILILQVSTTIVDRLSLYLLPFQIFVLSRLPLAFSSGQRRRHGLTVLVLCYSIIVLAVWLNFASNARYWLPYRIWS